MGRRGGAGAERAAVRLAVTAPSSQRAGVARPPEACARVRPTEVGFDRGAPGRRRRRCGAAAGRRAPASRLHRVHP